MAFLFLTSFCLFTVLFYSTSYCVPIESVGGTGAGWKYGLHNEDSNLRAPGFHFGNLAELCKIISQTRSQKLICLLCKGFDLSCLITTTPTPATTTASSSTTALTTSPTVTTAANTVTNAPAEPDPESEDA